MKFKMTNPFFLLFFFLSVKVIYSQAPSIQWQKSYGGSSSDGYWGNIQQTTDGGYIVAASAGSTDGDVVGLHGTQQDYWLLKLDNIGNIKWQKCLGGSSFDEAITVHQTKDKGYIISGTATSTNGDLIGYPGNWKGWIVKTDTIGTIQWQKVFGTRINYSHQTHDGGYIVGYDNYIVKLDSVGGTKWQISYDALVVQQTIDHGYIAVNYGNICSTYLGLNIQVIKFDSLGVLKWQKCYGGNGLDEARFIQPTSDGGYIIAGATTSNDGDVSGYHVNSGGGTTYDAWILKINSLGTIQWQKTLGGMGNESGWSIQQTTDGGYIVGGISGSFDGDVTGCHSSSDFWVVKLSNLGILQWQKCLGGSGIDYGRFVTETSDGGYIVNGSSASSDGDITNNHGSNDNWVVKLNPVVGLEEYEDVELITISPNPSVDVFVIDGLKEKSKFEIADISGRVILKGIFSKSNSVVDLSGFDSGIYFYHILGKRNYSGKLLKY